MAQSREDPALYQAIITRYAESLLRSKLSALEAVNELSYRAPDSHERIRQQTAEAFVHFARHYTQLLQLIHDQPDDVTRVRHHCTRIVDHLKDKQVILTRKRRLPAVMGDETLQLSYILQLYRDIGRPQTASFRVRDGRLVLTLTWHDSLPEDLTAIILSRNAEKTLAKHLSEPRIVTYIHLLSCQLSGVAVYCLSQTSRSLSFSWKLANQLQIKL